MTYADPLQRRDLIRGLRMLADLLESSPETPAPYSTDVLVFPPHGPDQDICAEIDRIAALIGAEPHDQTAEYGHYTASRSFGRVQYRAVAILSRTRAYHDAWASCSGSVIPDRSEEG
jgi:hypothetical protein